jgi:hypothetical protein
MSDVVPTTIRFEETINSSQRPLGDFEMSRTETTHTIEASQSEISDKPGSSTFTKFDSPV